ncbi:MAG: TolC family protein [Myxococcota bacterium]
MDSLGPRPPSTSCSSFSSLTAARASANAISWERVPEVSVVAGALHQEGLHLGVPRDSTYVGLDAHWVAWAWNRGGSATGAANAAIRALEAERDGLEAAIRLEVATRRTAVATARASWDVARASVDLAEENRALLLTRYESGAATTLELLDAESQGVRAKSAEATAKYGLLRAEAALAAALGS